MDRGRASCLPPELLGGDSGTQHHLLVPRSTRVHQFGEEDVREGRKESNQEASEVALGKISQNFGMWTWLESKATGLGRDTVSQAILASDEWWEIQESVCQFYPLVLD